MKILFLSDDFPPKSFGGAGIITYNLACGLASAGHELHIITTVQNKSDAGEKIVEGMKVYNLYIDYDGRLSGYFSLYNYRSVGKVKKLINQIKPEVIHAHNVHHYLSYYTLILARRFTNKLFLTTHDAMAFNYGKLINFYDKRNLEVQNKFSYKVGFIKNLMTAKKRYNPLRNLFIRYCLNKYPKKIFAISNRLKDALNQNRIVNVETVYYGISTDSTIANDDDNGEFSNKLNLNNSKVILFGGRLSEAKGGKIAIDALSLLIKKDTSIALLIAGTPNDYSKYLLKYAKDIGVINNIVFTGWLSREDMKKAYAVCDVCITPSVYFDAFNLFNIEAGAASKPVVGTCFGGTPEIILDKITGLIINPNNIEMFAEAIYSILSDNEYGNRLGKAGYERVKKVFNMDRYVKDTVYWYNK